MTPVVALTVYRFGNEEIKSRFLPKLLDSDFHKAWKGSIWFTELESGGSDLGNLRTTARYDGKNWLLTGLKWFTSIADADLIMTIARPEGAPKGTRGLCMFLLPRWLDDKKEKLNHYSIRRLKAKLGCKSVPSGEMDLKGAVAYPLCGLDGHPLDGKGLARAMTIISPSQRAGVGMMGEGICRRVYSSSLKFCSQRHVFGGNLTDHPNMRDQLLSMMTETEAAQGLLFKVGSFLKSEDEQNDQPKSNELARILVPMAKFRCCRRGVDLLFYCRGDFWREWIH